MKKFHFPREVSSRLSRNGQSFDKERIQKTRSSSSAGSSAIPDRKSPGITMTSRSSRPNGTSTSWSWTQSCSSSADLKSRTLTPATSAPTRRWLETRLAKAMPRSTSHLKKVSSYFFEKSGRMRLNLFPRSFVRTQNYVLFFEI